MIRQFLHARPVVAGRGLSGKATSTIGFERRHNRAFAILDEQAFIGKDLAVA